MPSPSIESPIGPTDMNLAEENADPNPTIVLMKPRQEAKRDMLKGFTRKLSAIRVSDRPLNAAAAVQ